MDEATKNELEIVRTRVPRYLFRAWNNTPGTESRISGGHGGLNTREAITPLYFLLGGQRRSVYELTKGAFTSMALAHLRGSTSITTELSSWAASLSFVLRSIALRSLGAGHDPDARSNIYISIIDTKELENEIFYVPSLGFLAPGEMHRYSHEYLAHGVIEGAAHKALPLQVFYDAGLNIPLRPFVSGDSGTVHETRSLSMERARQIGELYGGEFTLPMCLAVLTWRKRDEVCFREGVKELKVILAGITDLRIPHKWSKDHALKHPMEYTRGYGDVEQFLRLMQSLLDHQQESEKQMNGSGGAVVTTQKKRKRDVSMGVEDVANQEEAQWRKRPRKTREDRALKRLRRELKMLEIDMVI